MPFDADAKDTFTQTPPATHANTEASTEADAADPALWPVYAGLALLVGAWAFSIATFGLPGLFIPPLMMVPVVILVLIRLAWG